MQKRIHNIVLIWALIALPVLVRGGQPPGGEGPTTKGTVSITFPKGWQVNAAGGNFLLVGVAPQADKDATGQYQAKLTVNQDNGNKIDGATVQAAQAKQVPGYRVIETPTPIQVKGMQGVMFGGSFKSGNVEVRSRQYMFVANNQIYTITFTCLSSAWGAHQAMVEASVGSLTVK